MEEFKDDRRATRRMPVGRIAAAALATGGLAASVLAVSTAGASTSHAAKSLVISTAKSAKYGTLIVSGGRTLYTLKASKTACTTSCVQIWPEVLLPKGVKKATAGTGVTASKLGTIARAGGNLQVTYGGKALYRFSGDTGSGQVNGNITDLWGSWSDVVTVKPATSSGTPAATTTTTAGTGGVAF